MRYTKLKGGLFMCDQVKEIATRIKELREISGLSIEQLAMELEISADIYKEYESGEMDIPVSFLYNIAGKLKVELSAIFSGDGPKLHSYSIVRKNKGRAVERTKKYIYQSLGYNFVNKKAEPFHVTVEPEELETPVYYNSHPGQEFNFVLEGTLKILINGHELILNEGDSLYFDATNKHGMKAVGNKPAKFLAIIL
jgi:transcriptional regulator with XRE-family HTH domain